MGGEICDIIPSILHVYAIPLPPKPDLLAGMREVCGNRLGCFLEVLGTCLAEGRGYFGTNDLSNTQSHLVTSIAHVFLVQAFYRGVACSWITPLFVEMTWQLRRLAISEVNMDLSLSMKPVENKIYKPYQVPYL